MALGVLPPALSFTLSGQGGLLTTLLPPPQCLIVQSLSHEVLLLPLHTVFPHLYPSFFPVAQTQPLPKDSLGLPVAQLCW